MKSGSGYRLFGINVVADLPLCAIQARCCEPNVQIRSTIVDRKQLGRVCSNRDFFVEYFSRYSAKYYHRNLGTFLIENGDSIEIQYADYIPDALLGALVVGTPLGIVCFQRGFLVLHGAVVEVGGKMVCFAASAGKGKSTVSLSLVSLGCKVLADDTAVVEFKGGRVIVRSAYPYLKVRPELYFPDALKEGAEFLEIANGAPKFWYRIADDQYIEEHRELDLIVFLDWEKSMVFEPVNPKDAFMRLTKHALGLSFHSSSANGKKYTFKQLSQLLGRVPTYRFGRPKELGMIDQSSQFFIDRLSSL